MDNKELDKMLKKTLSEKTEPPEILNKTIYNMANSIEYIHYVPKKQEKNVLYIIILSVIFSAITGAAAFMMITSLVLKFVVLLMFTVSLMGEILLLTLNINEFKLNEKKGEIS